jgi:hypothetical protein
MAVAMQLPQEEVGPLMQADGQEALRIYGQRLAESREAKQFSSELVRKVVSSPLNFSPAARNKGQQQQQAPVETVRAELQRDLGKQEAQQRKLERDGSGCELMLCRSCRLPVGDVAYAYKDQAGLLVHGECMAQLLLQDVKKEEEQRQKEDASLKRQKRVDYDIGWKVERAPQNACLAKRFECPEIFDGMCCVVLEEDNGVHLAPTCEPAAAINLGYLATALEVRRRDGREPLFSLDPCHDGSCEPMQRKRFEPEWLAGTSVGEVMFQADVHLKELSMGEYEQPVAGMRNCMDLSTSDWEGKPWNAREWFVVKKAEVQLSEDDVLVPQVRMSVEAREQTSTVDEDGLLEDKKVTTPGHPLVRYADAFSHSFDLIAERKSVIHHLRELAKAAVMAKYFADNEVLVTEAWFSVIGEEKASKGECIMKIPQLWNERTDAQIEVKDGQIADQGATTSLRGVYGGVSLGLERTSLRPAGVTRAVRAPVDRGSKMKMQVGRLAEDNISKYAHRMAVLKRGIVASRFSAPAAAVIVPSIVSRAAAISAVSQAAPRGVDLNLNEFDLSSAGIWAGGCVQSPVVAAPLAEAFWAALRGEHNEQGLPLGDDDQVLLKAVFHPCSSDRREDGERFMPPDTTPAYVAKLRSLVREEEKVRAERRAHFLCRRFRPDDCGPLFPGSWHSALQVGEAKQGVELHERPEYVAQSGGVLERALKDTQPTFDKTAEDGVRFRIYKIGSLQVRSTQCFGEEEVIGAVFSTLASPPVSTQRQTATEQDLAIKEDDKITKATEYVEATSQAPFRHSFVELETESGRAAVTERLPGGQMVWTESPQDVEVRRCLAKVVRSKDCRGAGIAAGDMKWYQEKEGKSQQGDATYASGAIAWASGAGLAKGAEAGFRRLPKLRAGCRGQRRQGAREDVLRAPRRAPRRGRGAHRGSGR